MWTRDRHILLVAGTPMIMIVAIFSRGGVYVSPGMETVSLVITVVIAILVVLVRLRRGPSRRPDDGLSELLSTDATLIVPGMTLTQISELDPHDLEVYVLDIYSALGFGRLRFSGELSDRAATIRGVDHRGRATTIGILQRPPGEHVDVDALREFIDVLRRNPTALRIYVTTASFTGTAVLFAREHDIDLVNGQELVTLRRRSGALRG